MQAFLIPKNAIYIWKKNYFPNKNNLQNTNDLVKAIHKI